MSQPEVPPVRFELRDTEAPWLKAEFLGEGRLPKVAPDPAWPNGIPMDLAGDQPGCGMELTHPTPQCGKWVVNCETCGYVAVVTAAGRPDDPSSVRIPCKPKPGRQPLPDIARAAGGAR